VKTSATAADDTEMAGAGASGRLPLPVALRKFLALLPEAAVILAEQRKMALTIPDADLRRQALASLSAKSFHAWGAAAMGLGVPEERRIPFLRAVLALQTLADYLDNLADRRGERSVSEMRRLHRAMMDAVSPATPAAPYWKEGEGESVYLPYLVRTVSQELGRLADADLPGEARRLIRPYAHLQVLKHLHPVSLRKRALTDWQERRLPSRLLWWERAAGAGSTLPVFARIAEAMGDRAAARWRGDWGKDVAAFHILLDYAIDRDEDSSHGDFNLTLPAGSLTRLGRRLGAIAVRSSDGAGRGPWRFVVAGIGALYLTDPKALRPRYLPVTIRVMRGLGLPGLFSFGAALWARIFLLPRLRQTIEGPHEGS